MKFQIANTPFRRTKPELRPTYLPRLLSHKSDRFALKTSIAVLAVCLGLIPAIVIAQPVRTKPIEESNGNQATAVLKSEVQTSTPVVEKTAGNGNRKSATKDPYADLAEFAKPYLKFNKIVKSVIQVCRPTVVHIEARKSIKKNNGALTRIEEAGAGLILQHRGKMFVITNRHVIVDAKLSAILIQTVDGRFFNPTEVRTDRDTDLAVLYVNQKSLTACRFGDSDETAIGDFVVAIGSPFGLNHSISTGIISGKGRRDLDLGANGVRLQDFMQTDAAINPGNSGGPLLNIRGEVIGINTAIASNSGHNEGIGFAIPVNMVERVATDLIDYGKVRRGFLGVSLDSKYSPDKAKQIGLKVLFGARVTAITAGSPADKIDIKIGDVILKYDGEVIENDSHLVYEVSMTPIGKKIKLEYFRNGQMKQVWITIGVRKSTSRQAN